MPELPEVETYIRELAPLLRGRTVTRAQVTWERTIAAPAAADFCRAIQGQRFDDFDRRGKYMLLKLAGGMTLIVHLRMTGKLSVVEAATAADKHTHVVMTLDDGSHLHYRDTRKFGRIWLVSDPTQVLHKLGPEPLSTDFEIDKFFKKLRGRKASIKALLLDQSIVAGVGNIYADEALFLAGIRPARAGSSLSLADTTALHKAIQQVLQAGIAYRGSSLGDSDLQNYTRPGGEKGGFQEEFKVFRRTGKPCPTCHTVVERIVLAQRSTHFCPHCQQ